jgi:hypothetical protein
MHLNIVYLCTVFQVFSLPYSLFYGQVRLSVKTANLKNSVFWGVTSCGSCKNRRSSETSVLTRATWRNIPEYDILHSHRRGNLKSYVMFSSYLEFRTMDKFHKPSTSECYTPSTGSFRLAPSISGYKYPLEFLTSHFTRWNTSRFHSCEQMPLMLFLHLKLFQPRIQASK